MHLFHFEIPISIDNVYLSVYHNKNLQEHLRLIAYCLEKG